MDELHSIEIPIYIQKEQKGNKIKCKRKVLFMIKKKHKRKEDNVHKK